MVAGAIANKPQNGGESWVRLSWILGLKMLGFEVHFIEQGGRKSVKYLEQVAARFGLAGRVSVVTPNGNAIDGHAAAELTAIADRSDFLVNISGNLSTPGLLSRFRRRVYIDIDQGYTQFWHAAGQLGTLLRQHDAWFTVGENIGTRACPVPTDSIPWRTVRPPVLLDQWPMSAAAQTDRLTTVAGWRGAFGAVEAGATGMA